MADRQGKSVPYYQQVANVLRARIVGMDEPHPVRLPKEEELAGAHGVARGTIRQALQMLQQEGLIRRVKRSGTFTVPDGIGAWRRLRNSQIVQVISSWSSLPERPTSFHGRIYQGILDAAEQDGYQAACTRMGGPFPRINQWYVPADPKRVVGVIIVGVYDERMIRMHVEAGYPVVCVDYWPVHPDADGVIFDCYGEGQAAAEFLLEQGHRELFFLGDCIFDQQKVPHHESDADLLEAGFRRSIREAGLLLPSDRVLFTPRTEDYMTRAASWFLSLRPRPTAGLVFDMELMDGFREALAGHGLNCPTDVSLICKSSVGHATDTTVLRGDPAAMGRTAVELLLKRASHERSLPMRVALASRLHRGCTVRCLTQGHVDRGHRSR